MDPRKINPERLSADKIRGAAEDFRKGHIFNDSVPVDIERVIESTMGIIIVPMESLQRDCDMEGYISKDFRTIYVDEGLYMDDRYYKRVRFTIAHEIGHLILHRSNIDMVRFDSESDWKQFRMGLQDEPLGWFETQASEFAGRLLVPIDHLVVAFKEARNDIYKKHTGWRAHKIEDEELFSLVAPMISPKFGVSAEVIERRLRKENIMSVIGQ